MDLEAFSILKNRAVRGVVMVTSRTFLLQTVSMVSLAIIGAFLQTSEIGIYIAVTAIMRIINFFVDFGFGAAIIQKKGEITDKDTTTAFSIQVLVTSVIFILVFLLRTQFSKLLHLPDNGQTLLLVLIFTLFLSSFKIIPSVMLERTLKFDRVIIPQIVESIAFNVLLIFLALNKFGLNSYIWSTLISSLLGIPAYYIVYPWKIRLGIYKNSLAMLRYGIMFQAKGVLGTIKDDLLTTFLIVFKLIEYGPLGVIGWWQRWAFFSFRFIVDSITKVSFSAYSRMQNDKIFLKVIIEKSLFATSFILFPLLAGLILIAPYFIDFIPKYHKMSIGLLTFNFFCLNAAVSSLSNILVTALDATGRVNTTLKLMIIWTILTWVFTPLFVFWFGFNGVAIASFIVTLTIVITVYLVKQKIDFIFIGSFIKPLIATAVMSIVVWLFNIIFTINMIYLFISIGIGIICYLSVIWVISKVEVKEFVLGLRKAYLT